MQIHHKPGQQPIREGFQAFWNRHYKWGRLLLAILIIPVLIGTHVLSMYYGANLQVQGKVHEVKRWGLALVNKPLSIIPNYLESLTAQPEKLQIDIKFENYQKIAFQRELALKYGPGYRVHPENPGYVPAKITWNDKSYKVKIRLKGGQVEHFGHEHLWSFKTKVRGSNTIMGMKFFSLQHPKSRGYLNEWVLHELFKFHGLIGVKYDYVQLTFNGKDYGIYAIEENMGKHLLERNGFKEAPILNYNSDVVWELTPGQADQFNGGEVNAFDDTDPKIDATLHKNFLVARNLLEGFRKGELKSRQVFNMEKMALFFAITDLTGYHHMSTLNNLKFYYNPIISRIEPIGYDNGNFIDLRREGLLGINKKINLPTPVQLRGSGWGNVWYQQLFNDPEFFKAYIKALQKVSDKEDLDMFFEKIGPEFKDKRAILHTSFPWYNHDGAYENPELLYQNQDYIRNALNPTKNILAYLKKESGEEGKLALELGSIIGFPLEVVRVTYKDSLTFLPNAPVFIQSHIRRQPVAYTEAEFQSSKPFVWNQLTSPLTVHFRILGMDKIDTAEVYPWSHEDDRFAESDLLRASPNAQEFDWINIDELTKTIRFKSGSWELDRALILPEGYEVQAFEGLQIDMVKGAKILSYSPLIFNGSEGSPIRIYSSDSAAQGIFVLANHRPSEWNWVIVDNLSPPIQGDWSLTGAITFYESPLTLKNCSLSHNRGGDDLLNTVRTTFSMSETSFYGSNSDAFDADFCQGTISNCTFQSCGNDAIDVSGTEITISNTKIIGIGDKALSAGEHSHMIASQIEVADAELAITSKDLSLLELNGATITNCKIGFSAYQKKPEFGTGNIIATQVSLSGSEIPYLIEAGSTLQLEGKPIAPSRENVKEILYGAEYGKSSK